MGFLTQLMTISKPLMQRLTLEVMVTPMTFIPM